MSTLEPQLQAGNVRVRRRWRLLARMLLGCLLVVAATAATVATGTLLEVKAFVDALHQSPQLKLGNELATANPGGPQTLLLIGSDKRAKGAIDASSPPHSDTMILVRLDPNQPSTTLLSVPRDLKVTIHPDHGRPTTQKINAAYSIGGDKLAVKTVKQVLGIQINHVIDINFAGFKALVNYLGCIYVQVDRRYYHSNLGLGPSQTYDEIDIQPGYQKLCGDDALHYVRYRHTDTDLVRSARQQDFLRQIKNQIGAGGLISRRYAIENIFGEYAETDIRSEDDVLKLLELIVQSASHPVRQVTFRATLGPSYVTATSAQVAQTVHEFLNGGTSLGHITTGAAASSATGAHKKGATTTTPLAPATADELVQARTAAASMPFRLYYPMGRVTTAFSPPDMLRPYLLRGYGHTYYAYVVVVAQGGLGQYYDLEGTTWPNPPILNNPNQTIRLGGRNVQLYFEGQRLRMVAWHDGRGVYWLVNTLQNILTNREMLAIAAAARPVS
jgi:polyisoprenyl-teichoic acid--peptidoglycan teichoic acid transferase